MNKPHLLLLHGALGSKGQFSAIVQTLENNFTLHVIDFPGHGKEKLNGAFGIELFADTAYNYIEKNALPAVDIFGYSMGGYVAVYLALTKPELVNRIFTLGTKFLWTEDYSASETRKLNPDKILEKVPAFAKQLQERHIATDWKMLLNNTADMMLGLGGNNLLSAENLTKINHKVRIGIGDSDNTVTVEEASEVKKLLQNAELEVFPATRHPLEKAPLERLIFSMKDFFSE